MNLGDLIGLLFFLLLFGGLIYAVIYTIVVCVFHTFHSIYIYFSPLEEEYRQILQNQFNFYGKLSRNQKRRFDRRLKYFINSKTFIANGFSEVTSEMIVLISASAVQLTFGLRMLRLTHFERIIIHPDKYLSESGKYYRGEVNPKYKSITLSWKHFLEGYANDTNALNVGLHEFAHALKIEDAIFNEEYNFFDIRDVKKIYNEFVRLRDVISSGNHPIIRSYGGHNYDEFFAVCVECFFEKPFDFIKHETELYKGFKRLLNLNPITLKKEMLLR